MPETSREQSRRCPERKWTATGQADRPSSNRVTTNHGSEEIGPAGDQVAYLLQPSPVWRSSAPPQVSPPGGLTLLGRDGELALAPAKV